MLSQTRRLWIKPAAQQEVKVSRLRSRAIRTQQLSMRFPFLLLFAIWLHAHICTRFISTQLKLEAEAREALPYVIEGLLFNCLRLLLIDLNRASIPVQSLLDLFDKFYLRVWHATPLHLMYLIRITPLASVIPVPYNVMASTISWNYLANETLLAIAARPAFQQLRLAACASIQRQIQTEMYIQNLQNWRTNIITISGIDFVVADATMMLIKRRARCFNAWVWVVLMKVAVAKIGGILDVLQV